MAASCAGGKVVLVGCVGNDSFGTDTSDSLKKDNIDVSYVKIISNKSTGVALINVANTGENSILVAPGANYALSPDYISSVEYLIANANIYCFTSARNPFRNSC